MRWPVFGRKGRSPTDMPVATDLKFHEAMAELAVVSDHFTQVATMVLDNPRIFEDRQEDDPK